MSPKRKTLADFEQRHGQPKIKALERRLAIERAKVEALADVQGKLIIERSKDSTIRFGLTGDRHTGSLYHHGDALAAFYDHCKAEGIQTIYDAGDVLAGHRVYKGQEFELRDMGFEAQLARLASDAPRSIRTRFITGNHDASFKQLAGVPVGKMIAATVPEYEFLGEEQARVEWQTPNGAFSLMLLHPGGGTAYALCFDAETEILTEKHGWVLFSELLPEDRVATRNQETGNLEWQEPTEYTSEPYNGELYHFQARSFDLLVTPNHRMYVKRYEKGVNRLPESDLQYPTKSHKKLSLDWQFVEAKDLANCRRQEWQMTKGVEGWEGETPEYVEVPFRAPKKYASTEVKHIGRLSVEDAAELISWYVTEGSSNGKQLVLSQCATANPTNHSDIKDLLRRIGFPNARAYGERQKDITVCSVELCEWLDAQCGIGSSEKHLPAWLKNCDLGILQLVFETMILGDGWKNGPSFCYRSISKQLRDDFSEIALKLGFGVTEYGDTISVSCVQNTPTINEPPEVVSYDGMIYCVSVPNSTLIVRRNGRVIVSGNSYRPQKITESLEGGTKPDMLAIGHYHKAELIPSYRNVAVLQAGTFERQTPFMARQGLAAHVGGWIVEAVVGNGHNRIKAEFIAFYV